jgi:DNA repair exonuclease SbcCD ATPase subunit
MKDLIQNHGMMVSVGMVLFIIVVTLGCYAYLRRIKSKGTLLEHRGVVEMMPSLVSTLGVLGTFLGITLGLIYFDTKDLTTSIPMLLDGLKTAFFTSLAGMISSILLSQRINSYYDKETEGVSEPQEAANRVVKALQEMQSQTQAQAQAQTMFYNATQQLVKDINVNINQMTTFVQSVSANIEKIVLATNSMGIEVTAIKDSQQKQENSLVQLSSNTDNLLQSVGNIEEKEGQLLSTSKGQAENIGEMLDHTESLVSVQGEISQHVASFGEKLHGEIVDIEEKMEHTNHLLETKFEEFAELLKKSNTEALVEVMKKVTEEFQSQMNALINKLIQENFDQLNKSVERLNTWQQENKEMIQSLTTQYKQMAVNFENTSTVLTQVEEDTRQLVSEGGKLRKIVDALNEVIVKDEKFIKISTDLQNTTELTKSNFEQFDKATKDLNEWVRKQRNFVDGVTMLIQKLEELNSMRSYSEQFWKETKQGMNEGLSILKHGAQSLDNEVEGLNRQFYARLSTTLAQLDNCIQALVTNAENRR